LRWSRRGELALELVEVVMTNEYEAWKRRALQLRDRADVFVAFDHNTPRSADGNALERLELACWHLTNIEKPDIAHERHFVKEGILFVVEDSGYKRGLEAMRVADRILAQGEKPAWISDYAPEQGPFIINSERARTLGIENRVVDHPLVEETIDFCLALNHPG
jgi:ABC-type uncharacterized transport system substrate-binding protein